MNELSSADEGVRLRLELAKTKDYLTINDVQLLSGYSSSPIMRRIKEVKLKALQNVPRGRILIKKENFTTWLESNGAR